MHSIVLQTVTPPYARSPRMQQMARMLIVGAFGVSGLLGLSACGGLLSVTDPTLVQDKDIATPAGANSRRLAVVTWFSVRANALANEVALFTDERMLDLPANRAPTVTYYLDRHDSEGYEALYANSSSSDPHLGGWDDIVTRVATAIPAVRAYSPDSVRGDYLAQLYAFRGYAILQMAEDICPGFPINDIVDNLPVYGPPLSTDSAVHIAITQIDSALKYVQDSLRFKYFAEVLKGRALLDLGQYTAAAAAVSDVPVDFTYTNEGSQTGNVFYAQHSRWNQNNEQYAVGEQEGGNGLPFVSAHDPRVPTVFGRKRFTVPTDSLFDQAKYTDGADPLVLASGLEAQLMQAEAALNAGDSNWLVILNTLRSTQITPAMPALVDPGTLDARVDLLYRERAFWLYLTGRRLGDMRRLIWNYGRTPTSVFPTGNYPIRGVQYGTGTAIPFVQAVEGRVNPKITSGCTTR